MPARGTKGKGLGLWPTPNAQEKHETPDRWQLLAHKRKSSKESIYNSNYPRQFSADSIGRRYDDPRQERSRLISPYRNGRNGAKPTPEFGTAKGFPLGWTDCSASEMPSSRKSLR